MRRRIQLILLVLTIDAFFMHFRGIASRQDISGLSPLYVCLNLFAATAQFALYLHLIVTNEDAEDFLVHTPIRLEEYLNLAQFAAIWASHLYLFILYIQYSDNLAFQTVAVSIYILLFLAATIPICIEAFLPPARGDFFHDRSFFSAVYWWIFFSIVNPLATLSIALSLIPQAWEILSSPAGSPPALEPGVLAYQTLVFLGVAVAWQTWWMYEGLSPRYFRAWYSCTGWAVLNTALYAAVQGFLSLLLLWRR